MSLTEFGCYCGVALSALIARRLLLMEQLTFINRILLLYFTIDAVMGVLETYFSFKLYSERLEVWKKLACTLKYTNQKSQSIHF